MTALDLSQAAVAAARAHVGDAPRVTVECGNFFDRVATHAAVYDVIWDSTFLCALAPSARDAWADATVALLKPGGRLLQNVFPIAPGKVGGPPYALDVPLVRALLEPRGLVAKEVREDLAADEQHVPGGLEPAVPMGTAFVLWEKPV